MAEGKRSKDKESVRQELLARLQKFEEEDWRIFGLHHMHLKEIHWCDSTRLSDYPRYRAVKSWLVNGSAVTPSQVCSEGLVQYKGPDGMSCPALIESIFFTLWLAKDEKLCIVSYGEHKFNDFIRENLLSGAEYSMAFKRWDEVVPALLKSKSKEQ